MCCSARTLLMDYLTLLAAARLGGAHGERSPAAAARQSALGGGYAALAAVHGRRSPLRPLQRARRDRHLRRWPFWGQRCIDRAAVRALSGRRSGLRRAGRRAGPCGGTARCCTARATTFAVPLRVLLLAAAVGYAVSGVLLRGDARHGPLRREVEQPDQLRLTAQRSARCACCTTRAASLAEPVTGRPVHRARAKRRQHGAARRARESLPEQRAPMPPPSWPPCRPGLGAVAAGCCPTARSAPTGGLLLYFRPDSVRRADGAALDCVCAVGPANTSDRARTRGSSVCERERSMHNQAGSSSALRRAVCPSGGLYYIGGSEVLPPPLSPPRRRRRRSTACQAGDHHARKTC